MAGWKIENAAEKALNGGRGGGCIWHPAQAENLAVPIRVAHVQLVARGSGRFGIGRIGDTNNDVALGVRRAKSLQSHVFGMVMIGQVEAATIDCGAVMEVGQAPDKKKKGTRYPDSTLAPVELVRRNR